MTYPNEIFTSFAFLGFLLCAIPLPWHLEAWNTGTCLYMIWTGLACLNQFINSIIWRGNAFNWAPVWCDISTKFMIGTNFAIPAASLVIIRRLYHIRVDSVKMVNLTTAEKRRAVYVDLAIGMGIPVAGMILHYIPQGHRFNILEDLGCWPHTHNDWVAYVLVFIPPILIGLVSAVYGILNIIAFNKIRTQFHGFNFSGHSNLTSSRYVRLMCLAGIEVLCTVPLGCYMVYRNSQGNAIRPWISWDSVHWRFSRVDQTPAIVWRSNAINAGTLELSRWLCVVCALIFFGFFGFADEARKNYRSAIQSITKRVGISTGIFSGTSSTGFYDSDGGVKSKNGSSGKVRPSIPIFVHKDMLSRHDSLGSISKMSIGDVGGFLGEKKDQDEKASQFAPTLSYGGITLNDVGGTLPDYSESPISPVPSSGPSSASSPSLTRDNSHIEISSLRRDSAITPPEKAHTADVV